MAAEKRLTQRDILLYEIEKRGGSINTYELADIRPRITQYQRVLGEIRQEVWLKHGWILTKGEPDPKLKDCFHYRLIKPKPAPPSPAPVQPELFGSAA